MTLIVVDNFYDDPDQVRNLAINGGFWHIPPLPILRGQYYFPVETENKIRNIVRSNAGEIIEWLGIYARFQLWTSTTNKGWIHSDIRRDDPEDWNIWAGVVYLTPNAPFSAGTNFYKHKETGKDFDGFPRLTPEKIKHERDKADITKWERTDSVANKYNRAIFYTGNLLHCSGDVFGCDSNTGRITQTFFFRTEK